MKANTEELRRFAEMAAPGPWEINPKTNARFMVLSRRDDPLFIGGVICEVRAPLGCSQGYRLIEVAREANAAFIAAANPATVLSLLERIESLTAERDELMADRLRQELEFLEHWMSHACNPVGQDCCGRPQYGECCGSPDPIFMDGDKLTVDMAARHREVIALLNARLDAGKEN